VEPKNEENIGAVARVLKNFGFYNYNLYMVKPPSIGSKARYVASHARDLLATARIVSTIEEAVKDASIVVGTTSKRGISKRLLGRAELTPREIQTLRGILRKAEWKILYSHTSNK